MVKYFLISIILMLQFNAFGQSTKKLSRSRMLQIAPSITFGKMRDQVDNFYIQSALNYFTNKSRIALTINGAYLVQTVSENDPLRMNNHILLGGAYYLSKKRWAPYVGYQTGLAWAARTDSVMGVDLRPVQSDVGLVPINSISGGITFFGNDYFSAFAEIKLVRGLLLSNAWPKYLDELRFSVGLAFQIPSKK